MGYSAVALEATSTIVSNKGLSVNTNLANILASYNASPTVSTTSAMFNTAAAVNDNGQLIAALKALGSTASVLFGVAPTTGVPNFTSNISTQALAPFSNGVAGFANVMMQTIPFMLQSYDIASSSQLLNGKTYEMCGAGFSSRADLVTAGLATLSKPISKAVAGFGTMFSISNISRLSDPYVFTKNLLDQGLGYIGDLKTKLSDIGLTSQNILTPPQGVAGNSADALMGVLSQIQGQDLLDIISATQFVPTGSLTSLGDVLVLANITTRDVYNTLVSNDIVTLSDLSAYLNVKLGVGRFSSFSDLSATLNSIVVPTLDATTQPTDLVMSADTVSSLTSVTGSGTGPFKNPTIVDILGCCAGIPYTNNFSNIVSVLNATDVSTVLTGLSQVYSAANTYISGGLVNVAPVATAVQNLNVTASTLVAGTNLATAQSLYNSCYSHYTNEVSLLALGNITITNPAPTPNRLADLARTITNVGMDTNQFGLMTFFMSVANVKTDGDSIKSVLAENYNSQLLQSKGIVFNNSIDPAQKLLQARKLDVPVDVVKQLAK